MSYIILQRFSLYICLLILEDVIEYWRLETVVVAEVVIRVPASCLATPATVSTGW